MSKVDQVLGELAAVGALGTTVPGLSIQLDAVQLESGAPSVVLKDARGAEMSLTCNRLAELMRSISKQCAEVAVVADKLGSIWKTDELPNMEVPVEAPVAAAKSPVSRTLPKTSEPSSEPVEAVDVPGYAAALDMARRKVRGEDLSPSELASAHGEVAEDSDIVADSDAPMLRLPNLKPSFPEEN